MSAEGHGAYLINSKGLSYSSTNLEDNKQQKPLSFEEGDIVNLIYEEGNLYFERTPNKKSMNEAQEVSLAVGISEADAKSYNFCVYLGGSGDTVELIWNSN